MPRRTRPKQWNLSLKDLERLREKAWYLRVNPITGSVSFWFSKWDPDTRRKKAVYFMSLPSDTPLAEINRVCEGIGCPPPLTPKAQRKAWRLGWRRRNGFPEHGRRAKPERIRRLVNVGIIENIADTRPDEEAEEILEGMDREDHERADLEDEDADAYERNEEVPSDDD